MPKTNWIVQVDPKTNTPYYWNFATNETTWSIPTEYQEYLNNYEIYRKIEQEKKEHARNNAKDKSNSSSPQNASPKLNARKRRRIKRASMRTDSQKEKDHQVEGSIEFLSEYIKYNSSTTSSSTSESDNGEDIIKSAENESDVFFGPNLPSPTMAEDNSISEEFRESDKIALNSNTDHEIQMNLLETSQILIEKFSAIDTQQERLSPIQIAYIQFVVSYPFKVSLIKRNFRPDTKIGNMATYLMSGTPRNWKNVKNFF